MNQLNEKGLITGLEQNTPLMNVDSFIPKAVPSTQNAKARRKGWPVGYSSVHTASAEGHFQRKPTSICQNATAIKMGAGR